MNENAKKWIVWGVTIVIAAVIALLIARHQGLAMQNPFQLNARYLSDGCFVVGLMMSGIGLMTWISTTGFFDMMSYGIQYGMRAFIGLFSAQRKPKNKNFYDYKMEKEEKRGNPAYSILICGVLFVVLSLIFLKIYYM